MDEEEEELLELPWKQLRKKAPSSQSKWIPTHCRCLAIQATFAAVLIFIAILGGVQVLPPPSLLINAGVAIAARRTCRAFDASALTELAEHSIRSVRWKILSPPLLPLSQARTSTVLVAAWLGILPSTPKRHLFRPSPPPLLPRPPARQQPHTPPKQRSIKTAVL